MTRKERKGMTMNIKEPIEELSSRNPEEEITVLDALQDCETTEVYLSERAEGLLIASVKI